MFNLMYHTGVFTKVLTAFATTSADPENFHTAVEAVAMHRLENPVATAKNEEAIKTGHPEAMITPAMEVAATLFAQFGPPATTGKTNVEQSNVSVIPFDASTFDLIGLESVRNMYNSTVEAGYIAPLMLAFNKEIIDQPENIVVAVIGFGANPDVDFFVITLDLQTIRNELKIDESISAGHDMIVFPLLLSLKDLQMENSVTMISNTKGAYTRLFLLQREAAQPNSTETTQSEEATD